MRMNLFIALTPYHLILSRILSSYRDCDHVLLVDETGRLESLRDRFEQGFHSGLFYFHPEYDGKLRKIASLTKRLNLHSEIRSRMPAIFSNRYDSVFVFNDSPYEVQYIISSLLGRPQVTYIEDGSAPYNGHKLKRSWFSRILARILLGDYADPCTILGTSKYVDHSLLTFPDLARKENLRGKVSKIKFAADHLNLLRGWATSIFDGAPFVRSLDSGTLLLPPRLDKVEGGQRSLQALLRLATKSGKVYLKRHPLDQTNWSVGENLIEIPSEIPAELLLSFFNINRVIGDSSTSLMSIKRLYPAVDVVALTSGNDLFARVLMRLGVKLESSCPRL